MAVALASMAVAALGASPIPRVFRLPADAAADIPRSHGELARLFASPPAAAAPMMRWWWFGPAVTEDELEREMQAMKAAGIGGFEIQPVYPLELDDEGRGIHTRAFLSDRFVDALRFVSERAVALGLRVDVTLGSGWPFGGPGVPIAAASSKLRFEQQPLARGASSAALPDLSAGEQLIAVFLEGVGAPPPRQQLSLPTDRVVHLAPVRSDGQRLVFYIASRTGMQVKRAAVGGEGFVLDHYDRGALDRYLSTVGERLLHGFVERPPFAVFCDSLEAYEGDWTTDLPTEFRRRRGYDLVEHLPALVFGDAPESADVRHDWGRTLTELVTERFFAPLQEWAARAGTRLRAQAYGIPPATLSTAALVDIPEGEGSHWTRLTAARWASSAAHVYGRELASAETWTWLNSPAFRAGPLDLKAEADRHFLQGINQLVGHGWPYSPATADYPGWRFYAAAALNDHNPWWIVMPDISRYLQRVSYMLRQGQPVADIAVYLPSSDVRARFAPGHVNLFEPLAAQVGPNLLGTVAAAGFALDVIDDEALASVGRVDGDALRVGSMTYRAVVLPGIERMPTGTLQLLDTFARAGGLVIATRRVPALPPGFAVNGDERAEFGRIAARMFEGPAATAGLVADERGGLAGKLRAALQPDVQLTPDAAALGFVHRRLPFADVYFVANTSNERLRTSASFRVARRSAEVWDPVAGDRSPVAATAEAGTRVIPLSLEPYGSRLVVFSDVAAPAIASRPDVRLPAGTTLDDGWRVTFPGDTAAHPVSAGWSWTDDEARRYFSGVATYEVDVPVNGSLLRDGMGVRLDFGEGRPVPAEELKNGMRAWLEPPVREAAVVWVNGTRVGVIWCPPYAVDVTSALRRGINRIRIDVANLAVNAMAGRPLPSYRLLNSRYGTRFEPQDMDKVRPVPAGLLGRVRLVPFAR